MAREAYPVRVYYGGPRGLQPGDERESPAAAQLRSAHAAVAASGGHLNIPLKPNAALYLWCTTERKFSALFAAVRPHGGALYRVEVFESRTDPAADNIILALGVRIISVMDAVIPHDKEAQMKIVRGYTSPGGILSPDKQMQQHALKLASAVVEHAIAESAQGY